ncbi:NYN domain-containing protein [Sandaracinobacteroides saxicola]|uniref:NYN domain-containing protein n=1 Tax=Sandaracinobacteroides saxicola TaxID=2759707 RepID=A0A7G5IHQ7_9SPHN|nr:NYN domain-containing protein [Sandaracinobacteroides saxicola]QMW22899.1 NYN domain-containing protein [Sandaracinobacteroides saxicola]
MSTRVIILIDGGHLRAQARREGLDYNVDLIEDVAHALVRANETLVRVVYYDCRPYSGDVALPVSGDPWSFKAGGGWLEELARRNYFAVRVGQLRFRGWKPVRLPLSGTISDQDFRPDFEQKGDGIMLALDLAALVASKAAERVILVSSDGELAPALAVARQSGLQTVGVDFPNGPVHGELEGAFDLIREFEWPGQGSEK